MNKHLLCLSVLALILFGQLESFAQKLPFQGRLLQDNVPVNDSVDMVFSISELSWTESITNVPVQNGLYSVVLGSKNPLPENLFDAAAERSLQISVNGTTLSPVKLYPAMSKSRTRIKKNLASSAPADTAYFTSVTGGGSANFQIGSYTEMSSNGGNIPYYGITNSKAGAQANQYGMVGEAFGEANKEHIGVYGGAAGKGKFNGGVYGISYGAGNGATGYSAGSYNNGVIGRASNNSWGNSGVFGHANGTKGVDNIGVVGWSEVKTGSDTTVNNGVLGWAKGAGVNRGVVGLATGGKTNWAGWFEGDVKIEGKYLHARVDSITINDVNDRQAIVMESMFNGTPTSFIGGYGSNGKGNFYLYSSGPGHNHGNLGLKDAEGITKSWIAARFNQNTNVSSGLVSLYGPSAGWIGAGFKDWDADSAINLPYISLEGNTRDQALVWMTVDRDENGREYGALNLTAADGTNLRLDPFTRFGIPTMGPNSENFLMTGKDWEGKGDYPIFELRGTLNSMADGTGYTLPLVSLDTRDNGTVEWGAFSLHTGVIGGNTIQSPVGVEISQHADGSFNGRAGFDGPNSANVEIDAHGWEAGGADRGRIAVLGNSARADGNGGSYNPVLVNLAVEDNGTEQFGKIRLEDADGSVYIDANTSGDGALSISNGTGKVDIYGGGYINVNGHIGVWGTTDSVLMHQNGDIFASGAITANSITQTSDRRYKENIQDLSGQLGKIRALRGVSYYWKDKSRGTNRQIGVIAQELETVYPEFVYTNDKGFKSVNYAQMVAVLIEAIKELEGKVVKLEQENSALTSANTSLKNELQTGMEALQQRMAQLEMLIQQSSVQQTMPGTTEAAAK